MTSPDVLHLLPDSAAIDSGQLRLAGYPLADLAAEYGTPLYLYDEQTLRAGARKAIAAFGPGRVSFAVKACSTVGVLRILGEEGVGLDVVSDGEIRAGLCAGVEPSRMHLHGNLKTDSELCWAVTAGAHAIVLDNGEEIERLDAICRETRVSVRVMMRLDPPVTVQTHPSLNTSGLRSKFGFLWDSPELERALRRLEGHPRMHLVGLHIHLGSQIGDPTVYASAAGELLGLARPLRARGFPLEELSVGGGWAVPCAPGDVELLPEQVAAVLPWEEGIRWTVEPGRALVGRAGIAVYRVGAIKWRDGKRLIMVDGGMGDNPRPALYGARYAALAPTRMDVPTLEPARVLGRYCESGDVLARDVHLPEMQAGDLLAIPVSGAYHLSMASTYNLVPVPPAVLVGDGYHCSLTRRATPQDLLAREL